jgi:hypothetical protein
MKLPTVQLSPLSRYFITLSAVLEHPQSMLFFLCDRPSFTPIQNNFQNYCFVYFNLTFLDRRLKIRYTLTNLITCLSDVLTIRCQGQFLSVYFDLNQAFDNVFILFYWISLII